MTRPPNKNARTLAGVGIFQAGGPTKMDFSKHLFSSSDNSIAKQKSEISSAAQLGCLIAALQQGQVTTRAARQMLDVMHPASRMQELRQAGHEIRTFWTREATSNGKLHRIGKYVLIALAEGGAR